MITEELFKKIDWKDYFEDYQISTKNKSGGIKLIPIKRGSNKYSFEEIMNIKKNPTLDLSFNVSDVDDIINCFTTGTQAICGYKNRRDTINVIKYDYNLETHILTRNYNGIVKTYYIPDDYAIAIIKFLLDKKCEKYAKDVKYSKSENSENSKNVTNSKNVINTSAIFDSVIKPSFDNYINQKILLICKNKEVNYRDYQQVCYDLYLEFKQSIIKKLLPEIKLSQDNFNEITSLLWQYQKELVDIKRKETE